MYGAGSSLDPCVKAFAEAMPVQPGMQEACIEGIAGTGSVDDGDGKRSGTGRARLAVCRWSLCIGAIIVVVTTLLVTPVERWLEARRSL